MGTQKKKAIKYIQKGHLSRKIKAKNQHKKVAQLKKKKQLERDAKKNAKTNDEEKGSMKKAKQVKEEEMDVDEFLNADFLDDDEEENNSEGEEQVVEEESSSEEEDEDALDPKYLVEMSDFQNEEDDDEEKEINTQEDQVEEEEEMEKETQITTEAKVLTMDLLKEFERKAFQAKSIKSLRRLCLIFSTACRSNESADVGKSENNEFKIVNSAVYNRLMIMMFRNTHLVLCDHLGISGTEKDIKSGELENENSTINADSKKKVTNQVKWIKLEPVLRKFLGSTMYLLNELKTDEIQRFIVRELKNYIKFLLYVPKTARVLLKSLLSLWSSSRNEDISMLTFIRIRELALTMPFPFLELVLKGVYLSYFRNAKFSNENTVRSQILMGNCMVEIYGLDLASSYQHAFIYIRQLAVQIRRAVVAQTSSTKIKANTKRVSSKPTLQNSPLLSVLSWQFINCLKVWTAVVSAYFKKDELEPLIYPLSQVIYSTIRLIPTVKYIPLRFHCVKLLHQLAASSGQFIPSIPILLDVFQFNDFQSSKIINKKAQKNTKMTPLEKELNFELIIKYSKMSLEKPAIRDAIVLETFRLMERELDIYKYHISFPEMSLPLQFSLKKFISACKISKWATQAKGLLCTIEKQFSAITIKRNQVEFGPNDITEVGNFLAEDKKRNRDIYEKEEALSQKKQLEKPAEKSIDSNNNGKKRKKNKLKKIDDSLKVDEEMEVKKNAIAKMSNIEFARTVKEIDTEDKVEDFQFSSDEE